MNRFNIQSIHHPAFATPDLEKTIRFWRDLLGFKLVLSYKTGKTKQYFFGTDKLTMISFFEWEDVENPPYKRHGEQVKGVFQFDHLAFNVASKEDLFKLQDELVEAGVPVSDVVDHGFIYSIYTYDPNRIPLEFNWNTGKGDLFKNPQLLDDTPGLFAQKGSEPCYESREYLFEEDEFERLIIEGEGKQYFI